MDVHPRLRLERGLALTLERVAPAPALAVVVPAHDEAASLPTLLVEIRAALDGRIAFEVVVVDDGSGDGTADVVARIAERDPRVRLVRHARRAGQSAALHTGVRLARAPLVATLDADGQNDPADIPRLLAIWHAESPGDRPLLLAGHRVRRRDGARTRAASRIANAVRGRLLGDRTPDTGCGLKLFEREAFLALPRFDHMHRFLPALFRRDGAAVCSVPVHHRPRERGRSHYGINDRLWVGIVDLVGVAWLLRRGARAPVRDAVARGAAPDDGDAR